MFFFTPRPVEDAFDVFDQALVAPRVPGRQFSAARVTGIGTLKQGPR
jgi:hypothetical protein